MTAPNPPVNLIVKPPTVPRPAPVKPVLHVRPLMSGAAVAAANAGAVVVLTGAGPAVLAAGAAAGLVGAAGVVRHRMRVNRQASRRTFGHRSGALLGGTGRSPGRHNQSGVAASRRRAGVGTGGSGRMGSLLRGRSAAGVAAGGAPPRGRATGRGGLLGRAYRAASSKALDRMFPKRNRRSVDANGRSRKSSDGPSARRGGALRKFGAALAAPVRMLRNRRTSPQGPEERKSSDALARKSLKRNSAGAAQASGRLRTLMRKLTRPFARKTRATVHGEDGVTDAQRKPGKGRKSGRKSGADVARKPTGKIRKPDGVDDTATPKIEPADPARRDSTPASARQFVSAASSGGMTGMARGVRVLIDGAEELQVRARKLETPEGALEFIDSELRLYGELMRALAKVHANFHERVTEEIGLHPAVMNSIEQLQKLQLKAAEAADAISPLARKLEEKRIEALSDRRNAKWDHRANPGHAAL